MEHRLDGSFCYLMGPMDDVEDRGRGWREVMAEFLYSRNIGVLCPYNKPVMYGSVEDEAFFDEVDKVKEEGDFDRLHEIWRPIAAADYRMVDKADFAILHLDKSVHMAGSYFEACMAIYQRKPVIVHCPQGKKAIPHWLFAVAKHEMFFDDWGDVADYIDHVANDPIDEVETHNRWQFFDYDIVFNRNEK